MCGGGGHSYTSLLIGSLAHSSIHAFINISPSFPGLLIVGHPLAGEFDTSFHVVKALRGAWNQFLKNYKVKAFSQVTVHPEFRHAVESLMLGSGLGGLSCNTVCLPLQPAAQADTTKQDHPAYVAALAEWLEQNPNGASRQLTDGHYNSLPVKSHAEYCGIIHDSFKVEYNVMIAANFSEGIHTHKKSHFVGIVSPKTHTDIWIIGDLTSAHGDARSTAHHVWGYGTSTYHAHTSHPDLLIPPPLEVEGGGDPNLTNAQLGMEGLLALLIHVGAIADQTHIGPNGKRQAKGHSFRILHIPSKSTGAMEAATERESRIDFLAQVCARARFDIPRENIQVFMLQSVMDEVVEYHDLCAQRDYAPVPLHELSKDMLVTLANSMMVRHSGDTSLLFTVLPFPQGTQSEQEAEQYVRRLNTLTAGLPPTLLVSNGEDVPFIVTSL